MSDGYKRKHESGTEKRKKRQKREDNLKQIKNSLLNYVNLPDHENEENNIDPIFYNGDHSEIVDIETSEKDEHDKYIDPNDGNTSTDHVECLATRKGMQGKNILQGHWLMAKESSETG